MLQLRLERRRRRQRGERLTVAGMPERSRESYRGTSLIARTYRKTVRGKAWIDGREIAAIEGVSEPDVLASLRELVDAKIVVESGEGEQPYPDEAQYKQALLTNLVQLTDPQRLILTAHYRARTRSISAADMALAAGFRTWTAAYQQYSRVGRLLGQSMLFEPRARTSGAPGWMLVLAETDGEASEAERRWSMRPQLAGALKSTDLV